MDPKCQHHYHVPALSGSSSCTPGVSVIVLYPRCQRHCPVPSVSVSFSRTPSNTLIPKSFYRTRPVRERLLLFSVSVDQNSGKPCIDFLDDPGGWNPAYTMTYVLLMIQVMLSSPVLENAVNADAANMALNKAALYRQMVLNCVKTSRQIEDGSTPESIIISRTPAPTCTPAPRKIKAVSFENYYKTWRQIATSKTVRGVKNTKYRELESRIFSRETEEMKSGDKPIIIHGLLSDRVRTFPSLREADAHGCALCRLSGSHLLGSIADVESESHSYRRRQTDRDTAASYRKSARNPEPLEEEVDNLVAWTNSLSTDLLED
ncbi:ubiquitin-conjugating enzyme E2 U isoform X2 [Dendrobates tinctorius]|uniref:ubiquitin-conjugating enzyme E2 U isoform X2 n=1 Tax=Dendrobates tinctorius TaxID=92724 RepID=UPI003CC97CCE